MPAITDSLQVKIALSCRILAMLGMADGTTGHVSARIPGTEHMLLRCRTKDEQGIEYTAPEAVRKVDFDGQLVEPELPCEVPNEYPIHSETYRKLPSAGCVVHVHPRAAVKCSIAGVKIQPVAGAFNVEGVHLTMNGVPVYERSITLTDRGITRDMLDVMGGSSVCVLKGHGIVVVGRTVEEATVRAIKLESAAQLCWELALSGRPVSRISDEDLNYFAELSGKKRRQSQEGKASHSEWLWNYYARKLQEKEG